MDEALDWRISKNLNIVLCKECGFTRVVDLDVAKISVGAGENKLPRRRWHSGGFPKRFRTGISVCFVRKRIWEVG